MKYLVLALIFNILIAFLIIRTPYYCLIVGHDGIILEHKQIMSYDFPSGKPNYSTGSIQLNLSGFDNVPHKLFKVAYCKRCNQLYMKEVKNEK